jgi:hypothetical protein
VDIAAPGAYVLAEVDGGMLPNTWNADQLHKYYARCIYLINKDTIFLILSLSVYYLPVHRLKGLISPTTKMISVKKEMTCF